MYSSLKKQFEKYYMFMINVLSSHNFYGTEKVLYIFSLLPVMQLYIEICDSHSWLSTPHTKSMYSCPHLMYVPSDTKAS